MKPSADACSRVSEHLDEILEGSADEELIHHLAECDVCRDARFDAERAADVVRAAGADFLVSEELELKVLSALDAQVTAERSAVERASGAEERGETRLRLGTRVESDEPARGPATDEPEPEAERTDESDSEVRQVLGSPREAEHQSRTSGAGNPGGIVTWVSVAMAVAASVAGLWFLQKPTSVESRAPSWQGAVVQVVSAFGSARGLELCDADKRECTRAKPGLEIAAGSRLVTDGLTRAKLELSDGTLLYLDRATDFALTRDAGRRARLVRGNVVAEVKRRDGTNAVIELPRGRAEVLGTKFALAVGDQFARVDVSRGDVKLVDSEERHVSVAAGEGGELFRGQPPSVAQVASLEEAMAWSDAAFVAEDAAETLNLRGLGELRAQKPGEREERVGAVQLSRHDVKVKISGSIVKTVVEEVFANNTNEVLEGIFRFPLPPDAQIERLALDVDGELVEGAFVDRERASKIWKGAIVNSSGRKPEPKDDIIWVPGPWKDPALLEWQRGGRFELRVFPIPKRGSRRIVLAYTQRISPHGSIRRYTYPLAYDATGSTKVGQFDVEVQVRGHDLAFGVRPQGYGLMARKPSSEVTELTFSQKDFVPSGDLSLDYRLAAQDSELRACTYAPSPADVARARQAHERAAKEASPTPETAARAGESSVPLDAPYVAMTLRPKLPRWTRGQRRAFVLAVDRSRSMYGEQSRRAERLVSQLLREMDRDDIVTVIACDATCKHLPGGFVSPGTQAVQRAQQFLGGISEEGASDLVNTLLEAASLKSKVGDRALRVVYIGDGTPTVGPVLPSFIRREVVQRLPGGTTLHAVTLGAGADVRALKAATAAGGGVVVPYAPGQSVAQVAYSLLGATYGNSLRNISLTLPEGLVEVAPEQLSTIAPGDEVLVVARMLHPKLSGRLALRGTVAGKKYEQSYALNLAATSASGNAFVPRLFAATRIDLLENEVSAAARAQAVALSRAFNVASRHTSLLVLESPAMFKAFGLDNTRAAPEWTGEDGPAETSADGEVPYDTAAKPTSPAKQSAGGGLASIGAMGKGRAAAGSGVGIGGMAPRASAPKLRSAPSLAPRDVLSATEFERRRRWIPMRRVWERSASVHKGDQVLKGGAADVIERAAAKVRENPLSQNALKELYIAEFLAGHWQRAKDLAERWSEKDPLNPQALTARADVAAQMGERALALRILGSVVDMRPDDHKAQWRLARAHRWQSQPQSGCRYSAAVAQMRPSEVDLVMEALRCARDTGNIHLFDDLSAMTDRKLKPKLDLALAKDAPKQELSGDFRVEASWHGAAQDLDVVILHPDGYRVSWLGAPTRAVISARDVLSARREGLALRGAKPGSYAIELVRDVRSEGSVSGEVKLRIGKALHTLPFTMTETRVRLATVDLRMTSRLVPVNR